LDNPNVATVKAKPAITTIYTCSLQTANGCLSTKTVTVTVSPLDFNLSQNTTINCGDEVTLTAHLSQPIPNVTYKWTPGFGLDNPNVAIVKAKPAITTIYTCSLQTTNGCLSTKTVTITVNNPNPPKVNISSNTGEFYLCNGSLTLQGPSGFNMYQWSNNRLTRNNTVNTPGWYSLIAINQAGCAGKDSVEVTNLSTQPIKTPDGTVFCPDQTGQRLRLQAPEGMDSYKWSTGDETQSILVNTPGNYSVQVTKKGCNASVSVLTQMSNGQAHANFSYVPNGLKVNFTAISPSIQFATWNFGDGNTAVGELSTHTYKQSGNYNVTISVTDACGKNAEFTKTINVNGKTNVVETTEKLATINIYPNPNEGIFTLKSNSIEPFIIEIFDLQGSQLLSMQSDKKLETIDIRSLNKGIYILKAQSNKVILTERIILQ
jgi:chitodextrinase